MSDQKTFKRYELKFRMHRAQQLRILDAMRAYMEHDSHGVSTIQSLYYDTPDHLLIRRSLEHPLYKEKLRMRSYGLAGPDSQVFLELKKKYDHVVYKRRIAMTEDRARAFVDCFTDHLIDQMSRKPSPQGHLPGAALRDAVPSGAALQDALQRLLPEDILQTPRDLQIAREIAFTAGRYPGLAPRCLISYDRQAWYGKDNQAFRITFDRNILWRDHALDLSTGIFGTPILGEDEVLMEVKLCGAMPLWLTEALSRENIYKTSFTKYGRAYQSILQSGRAGQACRESQMRWQLEEKGARRQYGFSFSGAV